MSGVIAFVGGTGPEGLGLAGRFALAGEEVIIGSRSQERATAAATGLVEKLPSSKVRGMENAAACRLGSIVLITVPFNAQKETLLPLQEHLRGKIVVSTVVPLTFERGRASAMRVEEGSAAEQAQRLLSESQVASAFQNLSAGKLQALDSSLEADVIVCSDHVEARKTVMALAEKIRGIRALDGGRLAGSRYVEDFTAMLVTLNRIYKTESAIKIVGIQP